jgi:hypothetical protein
MQAEILDTLCRFVREHQVGVIVVVEPSRSANAGLRGSSFEHLSMIGVPVEIAGVLAKQA